MVAKDPFEYRILLGLSNEYSGYIWARAERTCWEGEDRHLGAVEIDLVGEWDSHSPFVLSEV